MIPFKFCQLTGMNFHLPGALAGNSSDRSRNCFDDAHKMSPKLILALAGLAKLHRNVFQGYIAIIDFVGEHPNCYFGCLVPTAGIYSIVCRRTVFRRLAD